METMLELPIGEQSFAKLRRENRLYVDKTEYVYRMAKKGTYYFLSRPRRFGKSLMLNTIESYFLGRKELFNGLYLGEVEKEWTVYPVMHLDFNAQNYDSEQKLNSFLNSFLCRQEDFYGANPNDVDLGVRFEGVIRRAYEKTGRSVVILVDEYDKPLLQVVGNPELQDTYRGILRGFFGALKSMDDYIRFAFLTGITKYSKVSIFSDLNNLNDISRDRNYANICGLTDAEVDRDLVSHIQYFAEQNKMPYGEVRKELQRMYDGYHFVADSDGLYNPFSIMCALSKGELGNYWFETGTPTMLVEMLQRKHYNLDSLEGMVSINTLDNRTGSNDNVIALLYQSGYLSIDGASADKQSYRLKFPNEEVRSGFFQFLLPYYIKVQGEDALMEIGKFLDDVREGKVEQFLKRLTSLFADFQYDAQKESDTEEHFRNVLFVLFRLLGLKVKAEYMTSDGRIDLLITTDKYRYVIECKLDSTPAVALQQIHDKEYGLSWTLDEKETMLIGLNFSTEKRRPDGWVVERGDGSVVESEKKNVTQNVTQDVTQDVTGVTGRSKKKERLENVLKTLLANRQLPQDEIAKLLGVSRRTIIRDFNALRLTYRIEWIGSAWEGHWEIEKLV